MGRFGPFLGCSGYPECKTILNLDRQGNVLPKKPPPITTDLPCPKCGKPLYLRLSKRGPWLGCSAFPRCRGRAAWSNLPEEKRAELQKKLDEQQAELKQSQSAAQNNGQQTASATEAGSTEAEQPATEPEPVDVKCDVCGQPMVRRTGRRGPFLGCSAFPKCRNTKPLPEEMPA